jgi:UDP-glucuronate decarboxylase
MHQNDGRVVSNFIVNALQNKDLEVFGKGTQTRSFCYVDDLIEGINKVMCSDKTFTGPVNLGNPEELIILDLANRIIKLTNSKSKLIYKPLPENDPIRRKPDISLAMNTFNWFPKIPLEKGLQKTVEYFKGVIND